MTGGTQANSWAFKAAKQQVIEQFERDYLVDCLRTAQGNITHAAESAGIHVTNFHAKMKKYGIHPHTLSSSWLMEITTAM